MDFIEAIILAVPCFVDHVLVSPCITHGNQGIQCPVDADQRLSDDATVLERGDGVPHALRAGPIVIVCKRGEARKILVILWVELAHIQALGELPQLRAIQCPKRGVILDEVRRKTGGLDSSGLIAVRIEALVVVRGELFQANW